MNIQLYNDLCVETDTHVHMYGQHDGDPHASLTGTHEIVTHASNLPVGSKPRDARQDFYIKIPRDNISKPLTIIVQDGLFDNLNVSCLPTTLPLKLDENSTVISTMVQNEHGRLHEWIDYHLSLGFSGVVLFDNDYNKQKKCFVSADSNRTCDDLQREYPGQVMVVKYPHGIIPRTHRYSGQRITLTLGYKLLKQHCKHVCFIDVDEFIHLPKQQDVCIEQFLQQYDNKTLVMDSVFLVNDPSTRIIPDNNVLQHTIYPTDKLGYNKIIINNHQHDVDFLISPHLPPASHEHEKCKPSELMHYHCWLNRACGNPMLSTEIKLTKHK